MSKEIIYTLKEYKEQYNELLSLFELEYTDNEEIDFCNEQKRNYGAYIENVSLISSIDNQTGDDDFESLAIKKGHNIVEEIQEKIKINDVFFLGRWSYDVSLCDKMKMSFTKIISFLEQRKQELETELKENRTIKNVQDIDLSNSNAVQKIIYLKELGIIDLLRKEPCFALSVNNLANVITAITGEKNTTIQPYLNVLINSTGHENNNPYKTTSTVEKVKNQLINLGVNPK